MACGRSQSFLCCLIANDDISAAAVTDTVDRNTLKAEPKSQRAANWLQLFSVLSSRNETFLFLFR